MRTFAALVTAVSTLLALEQGREQPKPGVCDREAEKRVGRKAVHVGGAIEPPRKIRNAPPKYPELPAGVTGGGIWLGEVLVDHSGDVAQVWPMREFKFTPPFPAFNQAVVDAIQQWKYEPLLVKGAPVPICITVTVNINWR